MNNLFTKIANRSADTLGNAVETLTGSRPWACRHTGPQLTLWESSVCDDCGAAFYRETPPSAESLHSARLAWDGAVSRGEAWTTWIDDLEPVGDGAWAADYPHA
jgi:hypothetical protein